VYLRFDFVSSLSSEKESLHRPVVPKMGGEAEVGGWGAIGDPVNISVVLLTLSDQMS